MGSPNGRWAGYTRTPWYATNAQQGESRRRDRAARAGLNAGVTREETQATYRSGQRGRPLCGDITVQARQVHDSGGGGPERRGAVREEGDQGASLALGLDGRGFLVGDGDTRQAGASALGLGDGRRGHDLKGGGPWSSTQIGVLGTFALEGVRGRRWRPRPAARSSGRHGALGAAPPKDPAPEGARHTGQRPQRPLDPPARSCLAAMQTARSGARRQPGAAARSAMEEMGGGGLRPAEDPAPERARHAGQRPQRPLDPPARWCLAAMQTARFGARRRPGAAARPALEEVGGAGLRPAEPRPSRGGRLDSTRLGSARLDSTRLDST